MPRWQQIHNIFTIAEFEFNHSFSSAQFFNVQSPASFLFIFGLFKETIAIFTINVKNVQPVYSGGIQTHDLLNPSLLL